MNHTVFTSLMAISLLYSHASYSQVRETQIPKKALKVLDAYFGKWSLSGTTNDIYGSDGFPTGKTFVDLATGNFNADNILDFAAMIIAADSVEPKGKLVVLLSVKSEYRLYVIDTFLSYDAPYFVDKVSKGQTVYDENDLSPHKLKRDAIIFGYQEKGGTVYYFDDVKFISFADSDGC